MLTNLKNTTNEDDAIFTDWMVALGMNTPTKLFHHICQAYREGRLLILDHATQQCFVSATKERTLMEARDAGRKGARDLLFEMGYLPG